MAEAMFVYAVRTTGIYCRPSCPSRRPLRASVEFYPTSELAEQAGYRACKRCTPAQEHPQLRTLTAACNYLDRHENETVKLQDLGNAVGLSPFHVQRIFRRCLGITPREYQQARRIERFRHQVAQGDTVTTALYEAGFGSSSRLYEGANQQLGMTPAELRDGAKKYSNSLQHQRFAARQDAGRGHRCRPVRHFFRVAGKRTGRRSGGAISTGESSSRSGLVSGRWCNRCCRSSLNIRSR